MKQHRSRFDPLDDDELLAAVAESLKDEPPAPPCEDWHRTVSGRPDTVRTILATWEQDVKSDHDGPDALAAIRAAHVALDLVQDAKRVKLDARVTRDSQTLEWLVSVQYRITR